MRTRSALPLTLLLSLGAAVTAQESRTLEAVLLVQFGSGDLVLNEPLLLAMVRDPVLQGNLRKIVGEGVAVNIEIFLPAPHLAGTFQLHVKVHLDSSDKSKKEPTDAVVDGVVDHLKKRLDALLHEQPLRQLTERREELAQRHAKLLHEHAALRARATGAEADSDAVQKLRDVIEQQSLAVRLDLATEQRANEHLEKARAEHAKIRDSLREERAALGGEEDRIHGELRSAEEQIGAAGSTATPKDLLKMRNQVATLQERLSGCRRSAQRLDEALADAHDLLARTLEQLPASTLAMQRARARLDSLEAERKELAERAAQAARQREGAAHWLAQAEQLQIDISVCRTLLTEVQGKLARLEPVRYELLRQG